MTPLGTLGQAMRRPLMLGEGAVPPADAAAIRAYLAPRIALAAPDGRRWRTAGWAMRVDAGGGVPDLVATIDAVPPAGADSRRFVLRSDALVDRVPGHFVLAHIRGDFAGARVDEPPALLGSLDAARRTVRVDRGDADPLAGFAAAFRMGAHHIAEGHDHLLFLLTLLLPAPLVAAGGRWRGAAGARTTVKRLALTVTAFTIGHAATLVAGAAFGWSLPTQPVEVAIALSILVSAIHAARPLFAGHEPLVAGLFGLVHGLAFATIIAEAGLDTGERSLAILGFNLGIEAVQLAIVAAVAPLLVALGGLAIYQPVRLAGAGLAGIAAIAWAAERVSGDSNMVAHAVDAALGHGLWIIAGLAGLAVAARAAASRRGTGAAAARLSDVR